jgi:thymidylate kinase
MVTYITLKLTAADAKERKRERDRAPWLEQKDAINKSRREKYHQRKNQHVLGTTNCNA